MTQAKLNVFDNQSNVNTTQFIKEWSEEDERMLKSILWHVSHSVSNGKKNDIRCDLTDWLKSLKRRAKTTHLVW